jgi:hypothetical protein
MLSTSSRKAKNIAGSRDPTGVALYCRRTPHVARWLWEVRCSAARGAGLNEGHQLDVAFTTFVGIYDDDARATPAGLVSPTGAGVRAGVLSGGPTGDVAGPTFYGAIGDRGTLVDSSGEWVAVDARCAEPVHLSRRYCRR